MILFYDTETTGFLKKTLPFSHPEQPRIVQLCAILDNEDGKEAQRIDLVLAHANLPESIIKGWGDAEKFHGISLERCQQTGVNEATAIDLFLDMVEVADLIVGQNVKGFDNDIINAASRRLYRMDTFDAFKDKMVFDTMLAAQPVCRIRGKTGGYKKPNLTEIHKHFFGTGFEDAHTAVSDVIACRAVFYELQKLAQKAQENAA